MKTSPCKDQKQGQGQGLDHKDQDKGKDLTHKDQDKDKDLTPKDQDKDKALKNVLKESLRTRTRTRTRINISAKEAPQSCTWLQFADDAVIIANNLTVAQSLINIFAAWCNWSGMSIRLDKCCTFGMLKKNNVFGQIEPALYLNSQAIPVVTMGDSF